MLSILLVRSSSNASCFPKTTHFITGCSRKQFRFVPLYSISTNEQWSWRGIKSLKDTRNWSSKEKKSHNKPPSQGNSKWIRYILQKGNIILLCIFLRNFHFSHTRCYKMVHIDL